MSIVFKQEGTPLFQFSYLSIHLKFVISSYVYTNMLYTFVSIINHTTKQNCCNASPLHDLVPFLHDKSTKLTLLFFLFLTVLHYSSLQEQRVTGSLPSPQHLVSLRHHKTDLAIILQRSLLAGEAAAACGLPGWVLKQVSHDLIMNLCVRRLKEVPGGDVLLAAVAMIHAGRLGRLRPQKLGRQTAQRIYGSLSYDHRV